MIIFLPESILLEIFSYLSTRSICIASQVSKTWRRVALDKSLWKEISTDNLGIDRIRINDEVVKTLVNRGSNLRKVVLNDCVSVTNKSFFSISHYASNIQELDVCGSTHISDRGLRVFQKHCKSLKILRVLDTRVTEAGLSCLLSESLGLKELFANASAMTLHTIEVLAGHCKNLEHLNVHTGLTKKRNCYKLKDKLTSDMVMLFALNCPELKILNLKYEVAYVNDYVLAFLGHRCPKLIALEIGQLEEDRLLTDSGISNFCYQLPNLQHLKLEETAVSDISLRVISKSCQNLRSLNLKHCYRIHDITVLNLVQQCTHLQSLHLGSGWDGGLTNLSAIAIAQSPCAQNLQSLSMYLWEVNDFGLFALSCNLPKLTHLSLEGCSNITYEGLKEGLQNWESVTSLDISFTECIASDEDLLSLFSPRKNMHYLRLYGIPDISALGLLDLKLRLPHCHIENEKLTI